MNLGGSAMTREEMISLLVHDRLTYRDDLARHMHLHKVLENGFRGFRNLADSELIIEIQALGLDVGDDASDEELDDFSDDLVFDSSLSAGHGLSFNFSGE